MYSMGPEPPGESPISVSGFWLQTSWHQWHRSVWNFACWYTCVACMSSPLLGPVAPPPRGVHYKHKYVVLLSISASLSVTNARLLRCGRAAFVYHVSLVDTVSRMPCECWRHLTYTSDGPDVPQQSRFLYTTCIVAIPWKGGDGVAHKC